MVHDIRVVHLSDFLRSDMHGHVDLEGCKLALQDIARACKDHDQHHVLIDTRDARTNLSVLEVWDIACSLEQIGIGRKNRIAILNAPKDDFDRAAFLETCAANRGFQIRAFREFEKAFYWLAYDGSAPPTVI